MNTDKLHDARVNCPHCGHTLHLDIDVSEGEQVFADECRACGDVIYLRLYRDAADDRFHLHVSADDEQYY
ncbi:MAG: CPXCG motif-containing cysteine-rich protein [Idiomarina sp.]|nr:CPXCG motif-containing cysteine-rich protein [Idiomarina sp.]